MAESKASAKDIQKMSFEEALKELETIVAKLESGEAALEASIDLYERGKALKDHCEARLRDAQARVEKISVSGDGSVTAEPANIE